ncbi:MAG: hypothetical protein ACI4V5_03845 [Prevotella sp.]
MKKFITAITALLTLTITANAMSYTQAREQALFLTDKMAYELNLTQEQYDAAYEVNLDYLMSVNTYDDLYGSYWTWRNTDMSYILLDWQYRAYCAASYFYRPLYWTSGVWHFAIYSRYPVRTYFYFGRPSIYVSYRGGHGWKNNGGCSWYRGRTFNHGGVKSGHGLKDRFDRGEYGKGHNFSHNSGKNNKPSNDNKQGLSHNNNRHNGNMTGSTSGNRTNNGSRPTFGSGERSNRESSTRTTVHFNNGTGNSDNSTTGSVRSRRPNNTFSPGNSRFNNDRNNTIVRSGTTTSSSNSSSLGTGRKTVSSSPASSRPSLNSSRNSSTSGSRGASFSSSRSSSSGVSSRSSSSGGSGHFGSRR